MALARYDVDFDQVPFNPVSKEHQGFIAQEIADFQARFSTLNDYDRRTEWLAGMIGCVWLFGSLGTASALFICTTYACLSHECFGRPQYAKQFENQLSKLLALYEWCVKSAGKSVTTNKTFLGLLEVIAPFVEIALIKKPLDNWKNVSDQFCEIMLKQPIHAEQFELEKKEDDKSWLSSFWKNESNTAAQTFHKEQERTSHLKARLAFSFYGRRLNPQTGLFDRGREILEPVMSLSKIFK